MVGPQQTTGLIGQKWKTGNGLELTGTNRPTQTTTPHPPHNRGGVGETAAKCEASTIRSTPNPPPQPHPGGRRQRKVGDHTTQPHSATDGTTQHCQQPSRWSQRQGNARPHPEPGQLSLTAPMVLHPPGCGRVGHHRAHTTSRPGTATQRFRASHVCSPTNKTLNTTPQHPALQYLKPRDTRAELTAGYETVHHCLCDS